MDEDVVGTSSFVRGEEATVRTAAPGYGDRGIVAGIGRATGLVGIAATQIVDDNYDEC
jgi:hypothetical protein